jgi:putative ABC transport system permease protein
MSTELRIAIRALARRPGFAIAAIATMALAIGLNSAVFSFIDGVLSPLPYGEPDRLVNVHPIRRDGGGMYGLASLRDVAEWRSAHSLSGVAAVEESTVAIGESTERVAMAHATVELFDVLAVAPARGRAFVPADVDEPVVLISDALWRDAFERDPGAVGATLHVSGRDRTVIGVMPPGIGYPMYARLWLPFDRPRLESGRDERRTWAVARLAPGADARQAAAELNAMAERLGEAHPETHAGWSVAVRHTADDLRDEMRPVTTLLFGAVFFVLLIACANVAGLMLARGAARRREIALRFTLGAHRRQVAGQLLLESAVLGAAGGALGLLLAMWGRDVLVAMLPVQVPAWMDFGLDFRAIAFTAAATLLAVLLTGLVPALLSTRGPLGQQVRTGDDDPGRGRLRRALVVAETALALMLLLGAGLLFRSALNVQRADLGYDAAGVTTAFVRLAEPRDGAHAATQAADIVARVERIGGVRAAAISTALPRERLDGSDEAAAGGRITAEGAAADAPPPYIGYSAVTPDFFRVLDLPMVAGRAIAAGDVPGAPPVAVVSESTARRLWPDAAPGAAVGRQIRVGGADAQTPWHTVVGVSRDRRNAGFGAGGPPSRARAEIYFAAAQGSGAGLNLFFRTEPAAGDAPVHATYRALADLAPDVEVMRMQPLEEVVRQQAAGLGWMARILGAFAAAALGLAMLGVYGVLAWSVARRTREIGIRMALGARASAVRSMVVRDGLRLVAMGAGLGMLGGLGLGRLLSSTLFGLQPLDPATWALGATLLFATALAAAWLPARAASRIEPMEALRRE